MSSAHPRDEGLVRVHRSSFRSLTLVVAAVSAWGLADPAPAQLTAIGSQYWDQGSPNVEGVPEVGDTFGAVLATGDFNCDGFSDLAIGVPYEDITFDCNGNGSAGTNECEDAGAINVLYGSPQGLHASVGEADESWDQSSSGVYGDPEGGDHFGSALGVITRAHGEPLNCDQLAVGVPEEDIGSTLNAGLVNYFGGTSSGLVGFGAFVQGQDGIPEFPEENDRFGSAIAQGPYFETPEICTDSIAIGASGENLDPFQGPQGAVVVVFRPSCFPKPTTGDLPGGYYCDPFFGDDAPCQVIRSGQADTVESAGRTLAGGGEVFKHFSTGFLLIGAPNDGIHAEDAGRVFIRTPENSGEFSTESSFSQGNGAPGIPEPLDHFGRALELANGHFLAVGAPGEDLESTGDDNAGAVSLFPFNSSAPEQLFDQDDFDDAIAQDADHFGDALAAGDFDNDGDMDLAIGAPDEDIEIDGPDIADAGAFHVLYGAASGGLTTTGNQTYTLDHISLPGDAQAGDHLGAALAAGDFDGDGWSDLAVGVPASESSTGSPGGVLVLYGGTGDGFLTRIEFAEAEETHTEGNTAVILTLERIGNRVYPISVGYNDASEGTASAGSDYQSLGGTLSWAAGDSTTRQITVNLLEDFIDEPAETIVLDLTADTGPGVDHRDSFTITISDDDAQPTVQHAQACRLVNENVGTVNLTVSRSGGINGGVTADYATSSASAVTPSDYTAETGTLTFSFNDNVETIGIAVVNGAAADAPFESFRVTLSDPGGGGALGANDVVTVWIRDDDNPTLVFAANFECGVNDFEVGP